MSDMSEHDRLRFGDAAQIALDAFAAPYVHYGIGPAGICEVCEKPLETVGDVNDGICPLCALRHEPASEKGGAAG